MLIDHHAPACKKSFLPGRFVIDVLSIALHFAPDYISQSTTPYARRNNNTRPIPFITYTPLIPDLHNFSPSSSRHIFIPIRLAIARSCRFLYTHHSSPHPTISWLLRVLLSASRRNVGVRLECPPAPLDVPHCRCYPGSGRVPAGDGVAPSRYRFACVEFLESKGGSVEEIPTRRNARRMGV